VQPIGEVTTRYHVALDVSDQPGVLAGVAGAFAANGVSIQTVRQEGRGDAATLVLVSHSASDAALGATVSQLSTMPIVRRVASVMRVEGMETE
jgi:homoserine dehydrogenase